jgi:hypothetical protein
LPRVLLLTTPNTYRSQAFAAAAERLGVEVVTAIDMPAELAQSWDQQLGVDFQRPDQAVSAIARFAARRPLNAIIAVDDAILARFDKRHTRADFIRAVELLRAVGLALNPTFVAFTPWTTRQGYVELLELIWKLGLVEHIAPIQYAIRLLIPAGSRLLELPEVRELIGRFEEAALAYPWAHPDQRMDQLYREVLRAVKVRRSRQDAFYAVWQLAQEAIEETAGRPKQLASGWAAAGKPIPHLSEPWYC